MPEAGSPKPDVTMSVADPLAGRVLNGRFSIVEPIGSGGMGKVYKAIQSPLDRVVALKVLHPQYANSKDPGFVKRFVLEASLTSKLRHPNTVTVIDYGQTEDGIFYIAMEYLEGQTVAEILAKTGAVAWPRAVGIGQQVCRSLREAHKFGILHRDLKPANVMLLDEADNDVVKVLDFGLVKSFVGDGENDNKITQTGMLLGSPQYMAPEQAKNQGDPRSDIYSFGVLMYEMLTGRAPFQAKDYLEVIVKHIKDPPPAFRQMRPDLDLPPVLEEFVMRCLQKEPHHRFQTMDEVLDAMRTFAGGSASASSSFQSMSQTGRWAVPGGPTPPPLPSRGLVTPSPSNHGFPQHTPAPGVARSPSGQYQNPLTGSQSGSRPGLPAPSDSQPLFGNISGSGIRRAPNGAVEQVSTTDSGVLFGSQQEKKSKTGLYIGAAVGVLVLILGGWLVTRDGTPPKGAQTAKAEAKPAEAPKPAETAQAAATPPAAGAAKSVRFKVKTEPPGAQVFMGAKDLGVTPTSFEIPAGEDGTAMVELVLIADGFHPLAVTAGGSGDVFVVQRLQKKTAPPPEPVKVVSADPKARGSRIVQQVRKPVDDELEIVAPPSVGAEPAATGSTGTATAQADTAKSGTGFAAFQASLDAPPPPTTTASVTAAAAPKRDKDGNEVLNFGEGMTRPVLVEKGNPIQYTREALTAKVQGLMLVKCVITVAGKVENCRALKSVPFMEKSVIESLTSRVYTPVTYEGKPVTVDYLFDIKLTLPRR